MITTRNMKATGSARKVSLSMSQSEHMVLLNNLKYAFGRIVRYSHRLLLVLLPEDPSFYEEIAQAKHLDWTASSL